MKHMMPDGMMMMGKMTKEMKGKKKGKKGKGKKKEMYA